ncbi:hypothetical protein LSH36_660g02000 [Paralvinella palmiformis]|uniref:MKRN2 opposite strand protein n=1 Tax=Paralvinella palmiformis TaxID=53620 RepID=A0AAD9MUB7_9ANNE|nr:hypothetical protein LSH36_660g02000 [Paralvinella palmiformis]
MMENDPIICFQHCESILCLSVPEQCPACSADLSKTSLQIPPFRLPSPFQDSLESPYSIVIKPTNGSFIRDYSNDEDLHVGVTDSQGIVYDYSTVGISKHESGWNQVLAILIASKENYRIASVWDLKLQEFCAYGKWQRKKYDEEINNCYTFGLEFLQLVQQHGVLGELPIENKSVFVKEMILPLTKKAAKYILLYRRLRTEGTIVQYGTYL